MKKLSLWKAMRTSLQVTLVAPAFGGALAMAQSAAPVQLGFETAARQRGSHLARLDDRPLPRRSAGLHARRSRLPAGRPRPGSRSDRSSGRSDDSGLGLLQPGPHRRSAELRFAAGGAGSPDGAEPGCGGEHAGRLSRSRRARSRCSGCGMTSPNDERLAATAANTSTPSAAASGSSVRTRTPPAPGDSTPASTPRRSRPTWNMRRASGFSIFADLPVRFVDFSSLPDPGGTMPSPGSDGGLGDMNAGFKYALIADPERIPDFPAPDPTSRPVNPRRDSARTTSRFEPSLLYYRRLSQRWMFQSQLTEWTPSVAATSRATSCSTGPALGTSQLQTNSVTVMPTFVTAARLDVPWQSEVQSAVWSVECQRRHDLQHQSRCADRPR